MIKNWIFIVLICIPGLLVLLCLGSWQLERLAWKENLINEIETRLSSVPGDMPMYPTFKNHNYFMTNIDGKIQNDRIHVLTSKRKKVPGFREISPVMKLNLRGKRREFFTTVGKNLNMLLPTEANTSSVGDKLTSIWLSPDAVSYTHLTLPTNREV